MEDLLRDDTLRAYFAMYLYDHDSQMKCLTKCMTSKSRYIIFVSLNASKRVPYICWWLPRHIV